MTKYLYIFIQLALLPLNSFAGAKILPHISGETFPQMPEPPSLKEQFSTYPGLNADFKIDIKGNWVKLAHTQEAKDIDIQLLFELNSTAADVWQSLVACNQGNPELAREKYYDGRKKDICSSKEQNSQVYKQLRALSENFVSFAISIQYQPWRISKLKLPPLHPLLGQKILEAIAWNKAVLHKKDNIPSSMHFGELELELAIMRCEKKPIAFPELCEKTKDNTKTVAFGYRILKMTSNFCTNYGLWPNQSLFLFAEWSIFTQKLIARLPSQGDSQEKMSPTYKFTFEGKEVLYIDHLELKQPNQLPPIIRIGNLYSPEFEARIEKAIREEQEIRYFFPRDDKDIKCWDQREKIISTMEQTGDYFVLNQMTRPIMEKYIRLYQAYVQL